MEDMKMSEAKKNVTENTPVEKTGETKAEKFVRLGEYRMDDAPEEENEGPKHGFLFFTDAVVGLYKPIYHILNAVHKLLHGILALCNECQGIFPIGGKFG